MFHNILVAIDRSEMSRQGFDAALSLAKATGARLILLHILSLDDEESPTMPVLFGKDFYPRGSSRSVTQIYEDLWNAYEARGLALLRSLADEATAQGVNVEVTQGLGSAGLMICEFARNLDVDLIILGRRGNYSRLDEWLLGSVSNYVLHHAPCSVLTIHRQPQPAPDKPPDQRTVTI